MHFIVTGGAGFIGSQLVLELAKRHPGCRISVVDDFSSANFRNLAGFSGDVLAQPCESLDWQARFGGDRIDCIFHLASITDTTFAEQRTMIERNVEGFRRLLEFARSGADKVVYASSAATYGQREGLMREDMPVNPANVYGFSKSVLENLGREAAEAGLPVSGVRYFNVYGPHEQHKGDMASMVYQLYRQMRAGQRPRVFRDGQHSRDFVYVKDAVEGTLLAAAAGKSGVFNIGSGAAQSFNELIEMLNAALGTALSAEYIDNPHEEFYQHHTQADLARSGSLLGFQPKWTLERGVQDYVAWLEGMQAPSPVGAAAG